MDLIKTSEDVIGFPSGELSIKIASSSVEPGSSAKRASSSIKSSSIAKLVSSSVSRGVIPFVTDGVRQGYISVKTGQFSTLGSFAVLSVIEPSQSIAISIKPTTVFDSSRSCFPIANKPSRCWRFCSSF
jgi:hypothetical protein